MKVKKQVIAFALSVCALGSGLSAARAQGGAAVENTRLFVELKTSTLYDAVQLVQNAVGRTDYEFADEAAAKATLIPAKTFNNAAWDNIIRNITNESGFKIVPQSTGKKSIELRAPVMNYGGEGGYPGSSYPGASPFGGGGVAPAGGGIPANPFGARRPQTQTFAAPQTAPGLAGTANAEGKDYRLLPVQHVYVGGIAKLFGEGEVISTEDFLLPEGALGGRGGGGGGGFGSGGGGIGITQGFGGNQGGGGFGGGGGGFGGGGGGFGGGGGGFGGVGGFGGTNNAVGGGFGF
jgi:hypothetical protein